MTAVQLGEPARRERSGASTALYGNVCERAERLVEDVDPRRVVPGRPHAWFCASACLVMAAALIVAVAEGPAASLGLARICAPWRDIRWPRRTRA